MRNFLEKHISIIPFCLIGGLSFGLSVLMMLLWVELLHLSYLTATALTWLFANGLSFFMNKRFTFRTAEQFWKKEVVRYFFVMACNFLLSILFMYFMVDILGIHYLVSSISMAIIMLCFNYIVHKTWSFRTRKSGNENY